MRIVGTMTTLPSRINMLDDTVYSILRQKQKLNTLYINIPLKTRKGLKYKIPSDFKSRYEGLGTEIIINRCPIDFGPITKLAPVLGLETHPDTYIISFDDDIVVDKYVTKKLIKKTKTNPNSALCFSGFCVGNDVPFVFHMVSNNTVDINVDVIEGVHVVLYKRSFFTTEEDLVTFGNDTSIKNDLSNNDDHRISAYLSSRNIRRVSIGYPVKDNIFQTEHGSPDSLSSRLKTLVGEHYRIISYYTRNGIYKESYDITYSLIFIFTKTIVISCIIMVTPILFINRLMLVVIYLMLRIRSFSDMTSLTVKKS